MEPDQRLGYGIYRGVSKVRFQRRLPRRSIRSVSRRNIRNQRADKRARSIAAALSRARIVQEEEAKFPAGPNRSSQIATENVLLDHRSRLALLVEEVVVGIEHRVAEKFVSLAVECVGPRLEDGVDVAASVAPLARVIERRLPLEFL